MPKAKKQESSSKQKQREMMAGFGLKEVTIYVPEGEAEGLRSRSRKLAAAARAKAVMDALGDAGREAMRALENKDYSELTVPETSGGVPPHADRITINSDKSAGICSKTPQPPMSQPAKAPATRAPEAAPAPTLQPSAMMRLQAQQRGPLAQPGSTPLTGQELEQKEYDRMSALLAEANNLSMGGPR